MTHLGDLPPELGPHGSRHAIEVDRSATGIVVRLFGALDGASAPAVNLCLCGLADAGLADLVVELEAVPFCDSSGLGVLLGAHRRMDAHGGHLHLHHPTDEVLHLLRERGLHRVLDLQLA